MTDVIDAIRRIVAEDAAHEGTTHEVYLRRETVEAMIDAASPYVVSDPRRRSPPTVMGLPLKVASNDRRDCIATIRGGQVISVTNL